jgi:hypothetical protein
MLAMTSSTGGEKKRKNIAVHVTRSAETSQRKRHPWLFDSDLRKISHEGENNFISLHARSLDHALAVDRWCLYPRRKSWTLESNPADPKQ